jgi:threonine/homoserine/homoserine lactone efflux protein
MIRLAALLAAVFVMGFLAAIPAGPVQVEVARRALNGHLKASFMVVFGAFWVDALYGIAALFGISRLFVLQPVMSGFWLAGGLILAVAGVMTIRDAGQRHDTTVMSAYLSRKRWSVLAGISLSITNPVMVLWWLGSIHIFRDLGMVGQTPAAYAVVLYIASGSLGLAAYLCLLALLVYRARDFVSLRHMKQINIALGVFLLSLSAYFVFKGLQGLL